MGYGFRRYSKFVGICKQILAEKVRHEKYKKTKKNTKMYGGEWTKNRNTKHENASCSRMNRKHKNGEYWTNLNGPPRGNEGSETGGCVRRGAT